MIAPSKTISPKKALESGGDNLQPGGKMMDTARSLFIIKIGNVDLFTGPMTIIKDNMDAFIFEIEIRKLATLMRITEADAIKAMKEQFKIDAISCSQSAITLVREQYDRISAGKIVGGE